MSAQVAITSLPAAGAITGTEAVPIVQNGVTVQTTTGAIAASPSQTQTFLTVNQEPTLPNSRRVGVTNGLSITDGGAQGLFNISTTGALLSLVNSGTGFQVKTSSTAITGRSIAVTGAGLSITDGDGIAGNPTIALAGAVLNLSNLSANGLVTINTSGVVNAVSILGTSNQVSVANGTGLTGAPTISLANNPIIPGTESLTLPVGTTGQQPVSPAVGMVRYNTSTGRFEGYQGGSWVSFGVGDGTVTSVSGTSNQISVVNNTTTPVISLASNPIVPGTGSIAVPAGTTGQRSLGPVNGMFRYNSDTATFEGYANNAWGSIVTGSGVTSVATGTGLTGGPITSTGTISIDNTGVTLGTYGSSSAVAQFIVNAQGQLTSATNVSISATAIGAVTSVSGTANEIDSTGGQTPVLSLPTALTFTGKTITGGTYTGASISGATNTLTNIPNSALVNSTISGVALGSNLYTLTLGTGLTGTSYNGSAAITAAIDTAVVATLTGVQTLTNKSMSGSSNTFTNIPNSALTNSSLTIGSTAISLGATSLTLAGLTSVTLTQDPTADLQAATKQYVDNLVSTGMTFHNPVQAATTQSLAAQTGGTVTYNNGTGGVGATITLSVALTTLDGYTLANTNRILVKDETNQAYNGVYTWATGGTVLTRATDADTYGTGVNQLSQNDYFFVQNGTVNKGSSYVVTTVGTITFGTTAITFAEFSNSQVYSAGTGLTLTGTTFSITNTGVTNATYGTASSVPTIAVNAQGQITSASNTAIAINGNQITSGTVGVAYGGTNLSSYTTGDILYASGATTLSKLNIGAANYVLTSSGTAPQYVAQSTLAVGTATNLAGGAASQIPYQTGAGATSFIANGTAGQVLTSAGAGAPTWSGISGGTF